MKKISLNQKMNTVLVVLVFVITTLQTQAQGIKSSIGGTSTTHGGGGVGTGQLEGRGCVISELYKSVTKI
jgi:hypothetical protein